MLSAPIPEGRGSVKLPTNAASRPLTDKAIAQAKRAASAAKGKPKAVYLAGPYSSSPHDNTHLAIETMHTLLDRGYAVYCPHLSHFAHEQRERSYDD